MKSHLSNGTILHHEITCFFLHCSVITGGNSLCSLLWGWHVHVIESYSPRVLQKNIKYQNSYDIFDCLFYSTASPPAFCGFLDISEGFVSKMWFPTLCFLFFFNPAGLWKVALPLNMETEPSGWQKAKTFDL